MQRIRKLRGRGFQKLSSAASTMLTHYAWPGNIRQLHHFLEQAGMLHDGAVLDVPIIETFIGTSETSTTTKKAITATVAKTAMLPQQPQAIQLPEEQFDLDNWQRAIISAALERHGNAPVRTAAYLGISRKVLYTLRKRYGLLENEASDDE
jgi:DNA-binding NtrC family response regulator